MHAILTHADKKHIIDLPPHLPDQVESFIKKKYLNAMKKLLVALIVTAGTGFILYKYNHAFRFTVEGWLHGSEHGSEYVEGDSNSKDDDAHAEKTNAKTDGEKASTKSSSSPKKLQPGPYADLDNYARKTPKQYEKDIPTLASYLAAGAQNEEGKARILFTWVATHINYDDAGYNSGLDNLDCSAAAVFKTRKAVCEGYSVLTKELGAAMGLAVEKISGFAKGYSYQPGDHFTESNHAWNAVKIDGKWRLMDVTWAHGYGVTKNGKLCSVNKFEPYWFDVNPREFLFTHLPEQSKWQLVPAPIGIKLYENLPWLNEAFFKFGFNVENVFRDAGTGRVKEFAETFPIDFPVKVVDAPYTRALKKGIERKLVFHSDYAEEMALIDGKEWYYFTKNGTEFTLTHKPLSNNIQVAIKINSTDKSFSTFIQYKAID